MRTVCVWRRVVSRSVGNAASVVGGECRGGGDGDRGRVSGSTVFGITEESLYIRDFLVLIHLSV